MRKYIAFLFIITSVIFVIIIFKSLGVSKSYHPQKVGVILFSEEFRESFIGFQEGAKFYGLKNMEFIVENISGDLGKIETILKYFKERGVKILFATTTPVNLKIKELNKKYDFFVIFNQVADPKGSGLVKDESCSGTNFIGVSRAAFITFGKRMEIFKDAFPEMQNILIFYKENEKFLEEHLKEYDSLAKKINIKALLVPIEDGRSIENYQIKDKNTGIFMAPSAYLVKYIKNIKSLADRYRIPIMAIDGNLVEKGATIAYSQSFYNDGFSAAYYLHLLLKGIDPKILPTQKPQKMELWINKKNIKNINMKFNQVYYGYADRVIE